MTRGRMTDTGVARWEQYNEAGRRSFGQGNLAEAEEYFLAAVREAELLGPDSAQLAASLNALGQLRLQAKDVAGAQEHLERALAIKERVYGAEHHALVSSLNNLGALHDVKGELDEAERSLTRALAICEQHLQPAHPDLALALNNLARLHVRRREFSKADRLLLRLLEIKRALGKDHPEVATVLGTLAKLRHAVGRNDQAEQLWRQALAIRERAFSPDDLLIATTLEGLADSCAPQAGRIADAVASRERALEIRLVASGAAHPSVAAARAKLDELRARADGPQPQAVPAPPPRSSRELPSPVTPQDERNDVRRPSGGTELPWLDTEPPQRDRDSQQIDLASVEPQMAAPPPAPPAAPPPPRLSPMAPSPFAAPPAPPRELAIDEGFAPPPKVSRVAEPPRAMPPSPPRRSSPRPVPARSSGQRRDVREEYAPRPPRRWLRRLVTVVFLLGLAAGGWVAFVRGYVHPVALLSRAFEAIASHAPSSAPKAAPAPRRSEEESADIIVPESLVSASTDAVADNIARDTVPDDGLHPKVRMEIPGDPAAGTTEVDAVSRAIDRSTKAKLDSAELARAAARQAAPAKP